MAIETQLPNIDSLSPEVIVMNDDVFTLRVSASLFLSSAIRRSKFVFSQDLTSSDWTSPLMGPLLRMQRDLPVVGVAPGTSLKDQDGEWKALRETNWMLGKFIHQASPLRPTSDLFYLPDERFGTRTRPYLIHVAKTIPTAIWHEVQDVFVDEMTSVSLSVCNFLQHLHC